MEQTYEKLIGEGNEFTRKARKSYEKAEQVKMEQIATGDITAWKGYIFESSSGLTPEFEAFSSMVERELEKLMSGYTILSYRRGHFEFSSFFMNKKTKKIVYVSSSDVRYFRDKWYNNLLIRTAESPKDHTGGANNYSTWPELKLTADKLTKTEV